MTDLVISYLPKRGPRTEIKIQNINEVRKGHGTDIFNQLLLQNDEKINSIPLLDNVTCHKNVCFSLVFNDATPPLDLIANSVIIRDKWAEVLSKLIDILKNPLGKVYCRVVSLSH